MPKLDGGLYRNPGGRFWLYEFKWRGRKYKGSTGHDSKTMAREWLKEFRRRIANEEVGLAEREIPTVRDLYEAWVEAHKATSSPAHLARVDRDFRLHLLPAFGDTRANKVSTADLEALRTGYLSGDTLRVHGKGNRTAAGLNRMMAHLRLVFRWAMKTERIDRVPFRVELLPEQETVKHMLRPDQVAGFLEAVDRLADSGVRWRTKEKDRDKVDALPLRVAVRMMLFCALREEEARQLRWDGFSADYVSYTPGDTKGREAVALPVPPEVRPLLAELRRRVHKDCAWCFPAADGEPHRGQWTRSVIRRAGEEIEVHGLIPHRMRGSAATILARKKGAFVVQKFGRWKDIKTAERYVHLVEDDLREAQEEAFGLGPHLVPAKIDGGIKPIKSKKRKQ